MMPESDTSRYVPLQAGPVSLLFDRETGGLRNVVFGDACVWRELVMLVRDDQWRTVPGELSDVVIEPDNDHFEIRFDCAHRNSDLHFRWSGAIVGDRSGEIRYRFDGEAQNQFAANRIGFCLMHPSEVCAGRRLQQHRSSGETVQGRFPILIEPQIVGKYSIRDLVGLDHEFAPDKWAAARFEGDIFETEDQRNWSDASYKTYCTPLERPYPVMLVPGESRSQRVTLSLPASTATQQHATRAVGRDLSARNVESHLDQTHARMEQTAADFGLGLCAIGENVAQINAAALRALAHQLRVGFFRCDLVVQPSGDGSQSTNELDSVARLASSTDAQLELVLQLPQRSATDWAQLAGSLRDIEPVLRRLVIHRRDEPTTRRDDLLAVRRVLKDIAIPIGGGSDANFCELNREQALGHFPADLVDFVSWSINPQVHATDDLSLLETPRSLGPMIATAREHFGDRPLVVSPITLKPRFNAVGRGNESTPWPTLPADPRQSQEIAAEWTRQTWDALASSGVASMTWFEAFGPRGVAHHNASTMEAIGLYPVAETLRAKRAETVRT